MVTKKILIILFTTFLLLACIQQEKGSIELMKINNEVLETEISRFFQRLDTTVEYNYVMWVDCDEINDTVYEYYAYPNSTFGFLEVDPFHFVCTVDNRPVFFAVKGLSGVGCESQFFKLKQEVIMDLIKREFPEEYIELIKKKENELYLPNIPNEYPESLILIFTNGKLTGKKTGRGLLNRSLNNE